MLYVLDSILEDRTAEAKLLVAALETSAEEMMAKDSGALVGAVVRHVAVWFKVFIRSQLMPSAGSQAAE